jgi:hypothetical protein
VDALGITQSHFSDKKKASPITGLAWELSHYLNEIFAAACLCCPCCLCCFCPLAEACPPSEVFLACRSAARVDGIRVAEAVQPDGHPGAASAHAGFPAAAAVCSRYAEPIPVGFAAEHSPVASPADERVAQAEFAAFPAGRCQDAHYQDARCCQAAQSDSASAALAPVPAG